jgi:hypothetical protein
VIKQVIRGTLDRDATTEECQSWYNAFNGDLDIALLINSLKQTSEYNYRIATRLQISLQNLPHRQLTFVHIPKTAGSSIRSTIEHSTGFPMMYLSQSPDNAGFFAVKFKSKESLVWPYQTGHFPLAAFPKGASWFTFVRDPISRLLSLYRQLEKNSKLNSRNKLEKFNDWIAQLPDHTALGYKNHIAPQTFFFQDKTTSFKSFLKLSLNQQLERSSSSLDNLGFVGWSHRAKDLAQGVRYATGIEMKKAEFINSGRFEKSVSISKKSFVKIQELTHIDELFIDLLIKEKRLDRLSKIEIMRHRDQTMLRLGFKIR